MLKHPKGKSYVYGPAQSHRMYGPNMANALSTSREHRAHTSPFSYAWRCHLYTIHTNTLCRHFVDANGMRGTAWNRLASRQTYCIYVSTASNIIIWNVRLRMDEKAAAANDFFFQMSLTKTKAILSLCYPSIEQRFHFNLKLDGWLLLSFHLDNARRNSMQCQAHSDFTSWKWLLYCFLLRNSGLSSNTLSGKHLRITNYHRFDLEERCFFHCFFF